MLSHKSVVCKRLPISCTILQPRDENCSSARDSLYSYSSPDRTVMMDHAPSFARFIVDAVRVSRYGPTQSDPWNARPAIFTADRVGTSHTRSSVRRDLVLKFSQLFYSPKEREPYYARISKRRAVLWCVVFGLVAKVKQTQSNKKDPRTLFLQPGTSHVCHWFTIYPRATRANANFRFHSGPSRQ